MHINTIDSDIADRIPRTANKEKVTATEIALKKNSNINIYHKMQPLSSFSLSHLIKGNLQSPQPLEIQIKL